MMLKSSMIVGLLLAVCALGAFAGETTEPTRQPSTEPIQTAVEAKSFLRQVYDLETTKQYREAIDLAKRVIAFDPEFDAEWPEEKIRTRAIDELATCYFRIGDWENALPALEKTEQLAQKIAPGVDTIAPTLMLICRQKLAEMGKLDSPPMVLCYGKVLPPGSTMENGAVLIPVRELAKLLHLQVRDETEGRLTLTSSLPAKRELCLKSGSEYALGDGKRIRLSVAPRTIGNDMLAPLRTTGEFFGARVRWEAGTKVARVQ